MLDVQHQDEKYETLTVSTQKGVDMVFDSSELTLSIDRFSERYIVPAAKVLAANIEADAMSMKLDIYNQVFPGTATAALDLETIGKARRVLVDNLVPRGSWKANLQPRQTQDIIKDGKALFHSSAEIKEQYLEGMVGRTAGFDFYENATWTRHTQGAGNGSYTTDTRTSAWPNSSTPVTSITVASGSGALADGDVFTIANVYRVNPETKANTGELQQFIVTAATASGAGSWSISPSIILAGPRQNVTVTSTSATASITMGTTASKNYDEGLAYHPDFATFATADLIMPDGVDFKSRKVVDGISMRVVRQYDINNDQMPMRIDILYGYKVLRPELAVRVCSRTDA